MRAKATGHLGHLLLSGLALLLPLLLYQARHLDNNSLTSWQWVFTAADPWRLFFGLAFLIPVCWLLALLPEWLEREGRAVPWPPPLWLAPGLAFLASLFFFGAPEVIVDAARYFLQAKSFSEYGPSYFFREWGREIFAWTDLPLMPLIYGILLAVFDESRLAAQLFNSLLFALTAFLIAVLGKDLWDEEIGAAGALLFLGFPYLYSQIPLLLVDIGAMFFLLLAMVTWHRTITRGGYYYPALCAVAVLAVLLSKYSSWLLLSGLLPVLLCSQGENRRLMFLRGLAALLPALAAAALLFWHYREVVTGQVALLLSFQKPGLAGWGESLISTFFFQTHPLLTVALLYSLYRAGRLRDPRYLILLWPVLLLLVVLEVRRIRYSIPIFPLLALMAGYGLRDLALPAWRRQLLLLVAGSSLLLAGWGFLPFLQSMSERNLQQAGRYLDTLEVERAEVVILSGAGPVMDPRVSLPLLDLFTSRALHYRAVVPSEVPVELLTSSLRFTWELPLPRFYEPPAESTDPEALVLILAGGAADPDLEIKKRMAEAGSVRRFLIDSGVFRHHLQVEVYGPPFDRTTF